MIWGTGGKDVVTKVIESDDGQVRRCEVRTANGVITRAINHLYPLELVAEEFISPESFQNAKEIVQEEEGDEFEGFSSKESSWHSKAVTHLAKEAKNADRARRFEHCTNNR